MRAPTMIVALAALATPASAQTYSWDSDAYKFDPGTCSNYAMDEVYTGNALGFAFDAMAATCCYARRRRPIRRGVRAAVLDAPRRGRAADARHFLRRPSRGGGVVSAAAA